MPFDQYRTVVAALDRLTTQVGRVADALPTPVTDEGDAPQTTGDDGPRLASWLPVPEQDRELRARIDAALEQADYRMDMRRGDLADAVLPAVVPELAALRAKVEEQQAVIARVRTVQAWMTRNYPGLTEPASRLFVALTLEA